MDKTIYANNPRIELVDEKGNLLSPRPIDYIGIDKEYFLDIYKPWLSSNGFCQSCEDMYDKIFGSVGIRVWLRKLGEPCMYAHIEWLDKKYLEEFVAKLKAADSSEYRNIFYDYSTKASDDFDEATKHLSKKDFRKMFQSEDAYYYDDYDDDDYEEEE